MHQASAEAEAPLRCVRVRVQPVYQRTRVRTMMMWYRGSREGTAPVVPPLARGRAAGAHLTQGWIPLLDVARGRGGEIPIKFRWGGT